MVSLIVYVLILVLPLVYLFYRRLSQAHLVSDNDTDNEPDQSIESELASSTTTSVMQAPKDDLALPKDDPFTLAQLAEFDGSDESKPIYVAIKGTVFDVTRKRDVYGSGKSYNIFAGKDGSRGLGMSSLKTQDAIPDYSQLPENEMKVLNDWYEFFKKRYNIVGRVVDLPHAAAQSNL